MPYEPYKAAITPLILPRKKKNSKEVKDKEIENPACDETDLAKESEIIREEINQVEHNSEIVEKNSELNREMRVRKF